MSNLTAASGIQTALDKLDRVAPGVPLLALGQTVFWDEPMKAGVAKAVLVRGGSRRFIAGVHDTDYFAKLPTGRRQPGKFKSFPHNDTTTRGLWSAAAEFSTLFGSESVVTRDRLTKSGLRVDLLNAVRPNLLDEATEAWGWRGIVSLDDHAPVAADVPLKEVLPELMNTLDWALDGAVDSIAGGSRDSAQKLVESLREMVCDAADDCQTLSDLYERLVPKLYQFASSSSIKVETERTSRLLMFNRETASRSRFALADIFLNSDSRQEACRAYDDAIQGSGIFQLSRFGTGAIPFDLYIPGIGRGTIRIGNRGIVINTPTPQFFSIKTKLTGAADFAAVVEAKFGPNCALVGKAVTLIGLLSAEFVFVFHEGASSYVSRSRTLHSLLAERLGVSLQFHPILRIRYETWDSLQVCCSWLRLPEPFQRPFGTEEVCAPSFAHRWRGVVEAQEGVLNDLSLLRRPVELIDYLDRTAGGRWQAQAEEYRRLHEPLIGFLAKLAAIKQARRENYERVRLLRRERVAADLEKGNHFRSRIFGRSPSAGDLARRSELTARIGAIDGQKHEVLARRRDLERDQRDLVQGAEVMDIRTRRRSIEIEAELKRLRLIREAVITSKGLPSANHRPGAWWFRLVCPDGLWFRETIDTATCYLEPLTP